jgi:hypothetical protein
VAVAAEDIADLAESFPLRLAVLVSVDLQSHGQPRVTEDDLNVPGGNAKILEQGGGRVTKMVDRDRAKPVS